MDEHAASEPVQPEQPGDPFQPAQPGGGLPPVAEVLDSAAPASWSVLPAADADGTPAPRRRRTPLLAGGAAIAVLVAAGGAYGWSALSGGGPQPAQVLPSTTVAFAEVDLNPSAGQKIALYQLLQKLPESSGLRSSDKTFGDWLVRTLSQGSGTAAASSSGSGLDFATDVKPWVGQRFAVAAVPSGSTVEAVVVVAETDEKAAAAAMDKLRRNGSDQLGYAFMDGYLVVTPDNARGAAAVVAGAQKAPLSSDGQFTADVASLGSDQVVTGWVDATKSGRLLAANLGVLPGAGTAGVDSLIGQSWKGRYVLGVHATGDSVELRMRSFGGDPQPSAPAARLDHVIPGAFAVLSVSAPGARIAQAWKQIGSAPQYGAMLDQARQLGLTLPGDLERLLGDNLTLSVGGDPSAQPSLLVAASSKDPAAARAVLEKLLALAGPNASRGVAQGVDGDTLYVASSGRVIDGARTGGASALTSTDLFRRAVADPGHAQVVIYVDLSTVWSTMKSSGAAPTSPDLEHLAAVGMSGSWSGASSDFTVRVVFS